MTPSLEELAKARAAMRSRYQYPVNPLDADTPPLELGPQAVKLRYGQIYVANKQLQVVTEPEGRWIVHRPEPLAAWEQIEDLKWRLSLWRSLASLLGGFLATLTLLWWLL